MAAHVRFHRYVAVLIATTVPLVGLVEVWRASDGGQLQWIRVVAPLVITIWAIVVARSPRPDSNPIVLATMGFIGSLVVVEAVFDVDITSFDLASTFGAIVLLAVLAGTLSTGNRLIWAGGLAGAVAAWVVLIGILSGDAGDAIGVRAVTAIAGVVLTTGLVAELHDQLTEAIAAHEMAGRLQEAVARCSEALLVQNDSSALQQAVSAIFEATDADYAYVDRTVDIEGGPGWEIIASAGRAGSDVGVDWQTGKYSMIPTTYASLSRGEAAIVHTKNLAGVERALYEGDRVLSEVCVPIFLGREFRGSIGFVEYTGDRVWTKAEIQTLWRAADMVGAYWRRHDDAEALRKSNVSKDRLLASVSHEIRTPLTAIVGLSEEIASSRHSMTDEELGELNRIIAVQSRELAELVEDLLVASRADFGNLSIRQEVIDLHDQVDRVLEGLRESIPTFKEVVYTGGSLTAWADPLRVRQILRNLMTNAIKYGGDRVTVGLRVDGDSATMMVADNGAGVDEHEATLIFERYYRSSQSPTQPGSVGIGLAVSRQLAEMMGGTLTYIRGDGAQHRFELTLPLVREDLGSLLPEPV